MKKIAIMLIGLLAIFSFVPGCVTTTDAQGNQIQKLDLDTLYSLYSLYVQESERLAAESSARNAEEEAKRQKRMQELATILQNIQTELDRRGVLPGSEGQSQ